MSEIVNSLIAVFLVAFGAAMGLLVYVACSVALDIWRSRP